MKRWIGTSIVLLCLALPAMAQEKPPALVKVATAVAGVAANRADMIGTLYFDTTSRVSSEEAARITAVRFREGDRVRKGAVLALLDSEILETEIALQKAKLAQIVIRMENTKRNLERYTKLFENQAASEATYDDLRFSYAGLEQERIALSRQVEILTIRLAKRTVTAPFNGVILEKNVEVGDWVQPGFALCVLGAEEALFVQVPVAEHLVRFAKIGAAMPVVLNAYGKSLTATMDGIRPQADPKTKNVFLKLRLPYTGPVAENMSATVKVPVSEKRSVVMIPRDAVVNFRGADMVYVVEDGKAAVFPVTRVYSDGKQIGVATGALAPGMQVVVEGNERLQPDQAVMVQGGK